MNNNKTINVRDIRDALIIRAIVPNLPLLITFGIIVVFIIVEL